MDYYINDTLTPQTATMPNATRPTQQEKAAKTPATATPGSQPRPKMTLGVLGAALILSVCTFGIKWLIDSYHNK